MTDSLSTKPNDEGADTRKDSVRQARDTPCDALSSKKQLFRNIDSAQWGDLSATVSSLKYVTLKDECDGERLFLDVHQALLLRDWLSRALPADETSAWRDPDDAPEITEADFARATFRIGGKKVSREEWAEAARAALKASGGI